MLYQVRIQHHAIPALLCWAVDVARTDPDTGRTSLVNLAWCATETDAIEVKRHALEALFGA